MDNKKNHLRMYSINMIAYILSKKPEAKYTIGVDDNSGSVYYKFDDDLTDLIREYKENEELQKFISSFKEVKPIIYSLREKA